MGYSRLDVDALLASMPISLKIKLLAGKDFWHFEESEEFGIPPVRTSDGPNGVRGLRFFCGCPSSCFPAATGLASSFDKNLLKRVGMAMADEARAKGAHIVLGPTVNIQRHTRGGRGFESYSEDPLLSGYMASEIINGMQSKHVAACIKHFVGNDQEFERFRSDSIIPERALREIYLEPFRIAMQLSKPQCFMSSYNKLNGVSASQNHRLLVEILRNEWGFDGLTMSDWNGTYSASDSIKAGLDVEMPGPPQARGVAVARALSGAELFEEDIDERVREVLKMANYAIDSGIPFNAPEESIDTPESRAILREAASSAVVVLKNNDSVLPLEPSKGQSLAVIGSNAHAATISGGGSASMLPTFVVSPYEALKEEADKAGLSVSYAPGPTVYTYTPVLDGRMKVAGSDGKEQDAMLVEFSDQELDKSWIRGHESSSFNPMFSILSPTSSNFITDGIPDEVKANTRNIKVTTMFTPETSGDFKFGLVSSDFAQLFVDGKPIVDNVDNWQLGDLFFGTSSIEYVGNVKNMIAGKSYKVEARMVSKSEGVANPYNQVRTVRVGAGLDLPVDKAISDATQLAKASDNVVVVVGLDKDIESEGFDRIELGLPDATNKLISSVVDANKNAVIVIQSGTPVTMPWVDKAPTVVQAFYGGNETGHGLSDVLFGHVDASGRSSLTFPKREEDIPAYLSFSHDTETPLKTVYNEGVYVGYRHYEKRKIEPLFPFGHGLSYTKFHWKDVEIISTDLSDANNESLVTVKVDLVNSGKRPGQEVVQIYVAPPPTTYLKGAIKKLGNFEKIRLDKGQHGTVTIKLAKEAFSVYNNIENCWVIVPGEYTVIAASSSANIKSCATVKVEEQLCWNGV